MHRFGGERANKQKCEDDSQLPVAMDLQIFKGKIKYWCLRKTNFRTNYGLCFYKKG